MIIDQLLDCNRVLISELLNAPKPAFTPRRGILDTDAQINRIVQDNTAAFYRTKLRALISGKTDSVFTDLAENLGATIKKLKNDKIGYAERNRRAFALNKRDSKSVRFSIVRSQRISPAAFDVMSASSIGTFINEINHLFHNFIF